MSQVLRVMAFGEWLCDASTSFNYLKHVAVLSLTIPLLIGPQAPAGDMVANRPTRFGCKRGA